MGLAHLYFPRVLAVAPSGCCNLHNHPLGLLLDFASLMLQPLCASSSCWRLVLGETELWWEPWLDATEAMVGEENKASTVEEGEFA
jgi:hypothetical protein